MLDVGSYRNAIDMLEDNHGAYGEPHPRYRSLTPDPYGQSTYRGPKINSYHSQQNLDGDWLSVPNSGSGNLVYSRNHHRSQDLDGDRMSRPTASRDVRFRGYSQQELDDEGFMPIPNANNSRSVQFSQHASRNDGRQRVADRTRVNGTGGRVGFHPEPARQSTSRVIYSSERAQQPRERVLRSEAATSANSFVPSSNWDETDSRSSTRMVFDGKQDALRSERSLGLAMKRAPEERQFLSDVQEELESQRLNWKDEIERMSGTTVSGARSSSIATKSSFVDTSGVEPCFKAYVDVREFPPSSVTVNVDKLTNKVIVEANQVSSNGSVAKTFTQKVPLPRFADDTRLSARMNREGILKIEVPLIYYFPEQEADGQKTKSFVYEVRKNPDGSKLIEILVKPGQDLSIDELRVEVNNDKLIVSAVKSRAGGASQKSIIKTYTLPENADIQGITSSPTRDGCLTILVPIYDAVYK